MVWLPPAALKRPQLACELEFIKSYSPVMTKRCNIFTSIATCCSLSPHVSSPTAVSSTILLDSQYTFERLLGVGGSATVRLAHNEETGIRCAIKSIPKEDAASREKALHEASMLGELAHDGVNRLIELVEDDTFMHLILEFVEGKDLIDLVLERGVLHEKQVAVIMEQLLNILMYCHSCNVVHRDVKPENIIVRRHSSKGLEVTLIDFGLAASPGENLQDVEGTPAYQAPETFSSSYVCDSSQDLWSAGIVMYVMLTGEMPRAPVEGNYICKHLEEQGVSQAARDLLGLLLERDPQKRVSANSALRHRWFVTSKHTKHV